MGRTFLLVCAAILLAPVAPVVARQTDHHELVAVYHLRAGRFILNTLRIRENLGRHPAAERLLRNMLRYAARDTDQPRAGLPPDFERRLDAMGYGK